MMLQLAAGLVLVAAWRQAEVWRSVRALMWVVALATMPESQSAWAWRTVVAWVPLRGSQLVQGWKSAEASGRPG